METEDQQDRFDPKWMIPEESLMRSIDLLEPQLASYGKYQDKEFLRAALSNGKAH